MILLGTAVDVGFLALMKMSNLSVGGGGGAAFSLYLQLPIPRKSEEFLTPRVGEDVQVI